MIRLEGVAHRVNGFSLGPLDIELRPGEYFVILGPTGTGKTSLLEIIAGLRPMDSGQVWFGGADVTELAPAKRDIGFVYQDHLLFPHLSVRRNIEFGLRQRKITAMDRTGRVNELAGLLGISPLLDRGVGRLSGGERQRVALARALAIRPRLLLLDEPLSALDPKTRTALQTELRRIHDELGMTTLHVTHNFEEAITLADRVGIMHQGTLVQVGEPSEVFRSPNSKTVADFIEMENIFKGVVEKDGGNAVFRTEGLAMNVVTELEGPVHACVRPEDILISTEEIRSSAQNSFRGRVVEIAERRALSRVIVRLQDVSFLVLATRTSMERMSLKPGSEVHITFKASAIHVF